MKKLRDLIKSTKVRYKDCDYLEGIVKDVESRMVRDDNEVLYKYLLDSVKVYDDAFDVLKLLRADIRKYFGSRYDKTRDSLYDLFDSITLSGVVDLSGLNTYTIKVVVDVELRSAKLVLRGMSGMNSEAVQEYKGKLNAKVLMNQIIKFEKSMRK